MNIKEILYFYRIVNWKNKISALRPIFYAILGYMMSGKIEIYLFFINTLVIAGILIFTYTINDFYDWLLLKENNFLSTRIKKYKLSKNRIFLYSYLPLILCLPVLLVYSEIPHISLYSLLILFLLTSVYSIPPLRIKERRILSFITPPLVMSIIFFQSYTISGDLNIFTLLLVIIIFVFHLYVECIHVMADYFEESEFKKIKEKKDIIFSLRVFPLISLILSVGFTFINYWFLITSLFSIIRFFAVRKISSSNVHIIRKNFLGPVWSVYEFGIYAILGFLGVF